MNINNRIHIEINNHVAIVTLNRPDKMNALDIPMFEAIIEAGKTLAENSSVRAVVLTGAGKVFCAGADVANFKDANAITSQSLVKRSHGLANTYQQAVWAWRELPVPVVAAVHGICYGGGLQLMLGADIKYITANTRLSIMEMKWGIIPDMGGSQLMRHSVRDDIIRELTYTNRIFSGEDAVEYGFATHVSENPLEDAKALAAEIAAKSPSAVVKAKKILNAAPYLSVKDGLMMESVEQDEIMNKKNQVEAVVSSMQKRTGNFNDYRDTKTNQ